MVCALSYEALGIDVAPLRGRRGHPLTAAQNSMCSFLKTLAMSVVRLGTAEPGCGLRLPATAGRLQSMREQLTQFDAVPYARARQGFEERGARGDFTVTQALPVVADRLSLPDQVRDFDPTPFLSPLFRHIYEAPDDFLKAPEDMPPPIRIRGTATRSELLKVLARWDRLHRLYICGAADVAQEDRCELFAVGKDQAKDRQILHRKRRNLREKHVVGASRDLPHGVQLCQLPLEDKFVCVCSVDDVRDFYHAYAATEARARSSPVGPLFRASEVSHLKAFQEALTKGRIRAGDMVACCFKGLGMGDHAAVDIAQESHVNVLRAFGAMRAEETLRYRSPVPNPPSKFFEGIMIDDHLGAQLLERRATWKQTVAQPGRDEEVFTASEMAYEKVGLEAHPQKRVRRSPHVRVWGVELEGSKGLAGPTRGRLLALAGLSAEASRPGPMDQLILDGLLGLWGFCAQFRRPLFSFMHAVYHQTSPGGAQEPFRLTPEARNELVVLACLAPLCITDLTVLPDPFFYCVDASPSGAGVCRAKVGRDVARELWRRGDKQGYRMPLLTKLAAHLKQSGADLEESSSEESEQPVELAAVPSPFPFEVFDFLEVYSGRGRLSATWSKQGFRVLPPLELKSGWDLVDPELFLSVLRLVRGGFVRFLWLGPPCTTFSLARCPKLRSLKKPWGHDLVERATVGGNLHAVQSLLLGNAQVEANKGFAIEQPAFGFMRALPPWIGLKGCGALEVVFDWCRYGCDYRKPTRVLTNVRVLEGLGKRCCHDWRHRRLEGSATTEAGAYSAPFCRKVVDLCTRVWDQSSGLEGSLTTIPAHPERPLVAGGVGRAEGSGVRTGFSVEASPVFPPGNQGFPWESEGERWGGFESSDVRKCFRGGESQAVSPRQEGTSPLESGSLLGLEARKKRSRRKQSSALWAVQLSESLPWKTIMQYKFRLVQHINLQEAKARRSLVKRLKRDRRVVIGQDSRVNLSSLGKGRSPSLSLNRIMRTEAPYLLGKNLYVSGIHLPTWSIRADAPSRGTRVEQPRIAVPKWFWRLAHGDESAATVLDDLQGLPRAFNRWCLLVGSVLLSASGGGSTSASGRRALTGLASEGSGDRTHPPLTAGALEEAGPVVGSAGAWLHSGAACPFSHRHFVRLVRRIHDLTLSRAAESPSGFGNAERLGADVRLAEILACRAVGFDPHLGIAGAGAAPSADAGACGPCSCRYCLGVELASTCGASGVGLFWLVETFRAHWLAKTRSFASRRTSRRGCPVHPGGRSQDPEPRSSQSTCTCGRASDSNLGRVDARLDRTVEEALERILGCL